MEEALRTIENILEKYKSLKNKDINEHRFYTETGRDRNSTEIEYSRSGQVKSITRDAKGGAISLTYIKNAFTFDPRLYIQTQLITHQLYHDLINEDLARTREDTNSAINNKDEFEERFGENTDYKKNGQLKIIRIITTPFYWLRGTTRTRENKAKIDTLEATIIGNNHLEEAVTKGKEFIENEVMPRIEKDFKGIHKFYDDAKKINDLQKEIIFIHHVMALENAKQLNIFLKYKKDY
jgi:hypothetical protein